MEIGGTATFLGVRGAQAPGTPGSTTAFYNKILPSYKHLECIFLIMSKIGGWVQTNVHGVFGDGMQGSCAN